MPTDETPTPKLHDALVVPFYTKDQVEEHVSAILAITKLTETAADVDAGEHLTLRRCVIHLQGVAADLRVRCDEMEREQAAFLAMRDAGSSC